MNVLQLCPEEMTVCFSASRLHQLSAAFSSAPISWQAMSRRHTSILWQYPDTFGLGQLVFPSRILFIQIGQSRGGPWKLGGGPAGEELDDRHP